MALDAAKWTKVMDGQWEIQPAQPMVCDSQLYTTVDSYAIFNILGD